MKALYLSVLLLFTTILFAQKPGTLDSSFGRNGRTRDALGRFGDYPPMLVQPDDKILTGGTGVLAGANIQTFQINRVYKNGAPDNSFGNNGTVLVPLPLTGDEGNYAGAITAIALQPDGKIVAAGTCHLPKEYYGTLTVFRFLPNGNIDSTFGINGVAMPDVKGYSMAVDMALQTDGKIVIGGVNRVLGWDVFFMERLLPNGLLDSSFGEAGKLHDKQGTLNALAIQPDGKILAAGDITSRSQTPTRILIRRYLPNGSPDLSFGKEGAVDTLLSDRYESHLYDIALQPGGKIMGVGSYDGTHGSPQALLTQYLPNGGIDKSFGDNGVVRFDYLAYLKKILPWKDKVILAGTKLPGFTTNFSDFVVTSYFNTGHIDSSFAANGVLVDDYKSSDILFSAVLQSDGKIVCSGITYNINGDFSVSGLLRYYGYPAEASLLADNKRSALTTISYVILSPNPASNYVVVNGISASDKTTIAITGASGKCIAVYNTSGASQYQCDVSKLVAGIYYVQIQTAGKTEVLKFIKK